MSKLDELEALAKVALVVGSTSAMESAESAFDSAATPATVLAMVEVIRAAQVMRKRGSGLAEFDAALAKLESKP